jgi:hypothetical protein
MSPRVKRGPVELATRRDLAGLGENLRAPSGLAASALVLAQLQDGTSPLTARDTATVAAEYRQTMAELRKRKPVAQQEDSLAKRRARRATRGAAG